MTRKNITFSVLGILFVAGLLLYTLLPQKTAGVSPYVYSEEATIGNTPISIARVMTPADLIRGLSGQQSLPEQSGLLFTFDQPDVYGIWMKDMLFPIDVVWLDEDFSVVTIRENFLPSSFPEIAYPRNPALFVLELPAGFTATHAINIGDKLTF